MGSQLTKGGQQASDIHNRSGQHQSSPRRRLLNTTTNSGPSSPTSSSSNNQNTSALTSKQSSSRIVVVNPGPAPNQSSPSRLVKRLPALLRPLIPIGQVQINPSYPQLLAQPIIDIGLDLERELRSQAELVAREQTKLIEKIRDIDQQVTASSITIGAERQRRFNKAVDNFSKFDEIDQLINRCETDIENILAVFVQLNDALPEHLCLEQFALRV